MRLIYVMYIGVMILYFFLEATRRRVDANNRTRKYRYNSTIVILFAILLMFCSGFREKFMDTTDYRMMYEAIGPNIENVFNNTVQRVEKGYLFFTYLLNCISTDSQLLLIVTSILINGIYVRKIYKYSEDVPFSLFLYFTLVFIGSMNGIRQTLVASVAVLCFEWIIKNKVISYIVLILMLSTFHQSVLVLLPVYFIARGSFFNMGVKLTIVFSLFMLVAPSGVVNILEMVLGDSEYVTYLQSTQGMSVFRFLVASVPVVMILLYKKYFQIDVEDYWFVVMTNLCLVDFAVNIMSLKILFFGRISMYFNIYGLIVMPIMVRRIFKGKQTAIVKLCALILYSLYFVRLVDANWGMYSFKLIF